MRMIPLRYVALFVLSWFGAKAYAQEPWTWEKVKERFEQNNPTLLADKLSVDESRAQEITAFLRPNPQLSLSADGTQSLLTKGSGGRSLALLRHPLSAICRNGGINGNYGWRAQKREP